MTFNCPFCNAPADARLSRCRACDSALPALLDVGDVVAGRYEVLGLLGAGPLGATYEALDRTRNADVALKVLADDLAPDAAARAAVASKLEMSAGRTIAGCAMPLEAGADDARVYVSAPRVDGVLLRAVLAARGAARRPLSTEESLRLMLSLSAAAQALHSATPHGALRPENVIVTPRGLILTDGAIAGAVPPDRLQARVKQFARAMPYVSPEAAAGKKVTATADLFALGAIAAELLAGKPSTRALEHASVGDEIELALRTLLGRDGSRRPGALRSLLDGLSRSCGYDRRPADAPLAVPEAPTPRRAPPAPRAPDRGQSAASSAPGPAPRVPAISTLPGRPSAPPERAATPVLPVRRSAIPSLPVARGDQGVTRAGRPAGMPDRPAERVGPARRTTSAPAMSPVQAPARVSSPPRAPVAPAVATAASTPAVSAVEPRRPAVGPERPAGPAIPSLSRGGAAPPGRSTPGEPAGRRVQVPSLTGRDVARTALGPALPTATAAPRAPAEPRGRSLDGIDPRLLRAAQRLASERDDQHEEVDPGEVEVLDE